MAKKAATGLATLKKQPQSAPVMPAEPVLAELPKRGSVQTVRMNDEEVYALKMASLTRRVSQQDIMLRAIRQDLGLSAER